MKVSVKQHIYTIVAILTGLLLGVLATVNPFYALDAYLTDGLYTRFTGPSSDIIIIGVDEETLAEYGNFNLWSREKSAALLEYLYEDTDNAPAVVGMDFMFISDYDEQTDARLAEAAVGNTVMGTNLVYRGALERDASGRLIYNTEHIADIEVPYDKLAKVATLGFTNACIASDGCVRYAMLDVNVPEEIRESNSDNSIGKGSHDSFAKAVLDAYTEVTPVRTDSKGQFQFMYSGKTGEFQHVSMRAVLAGEVPHTAFKDKIVLAGAYAPGFQDAYKPAADRGKSMYGVEIHANIIQALMEHKTMVPIGRPVLTLLTFIFIAGFLIFARKRKLSVILIVSALTAGVYILLGRILATVGIGGSHLYIPCAYVLITLVIADIYFIIEKYVLERIRRKHTLDVFKKYVAPEIVDNLSKSGDFELHLGGEKRDVAVLFVDIRGFTPLSEGLEPEKVVAILNEYLKLTTTCILRHKGTLDKFIGDATMAVFNAPFDLDDYIYEAVAAAWDIKAGSRELGERLYEEFGKQVGFGVGVNCGEAVVGNIGCYFRMDYTAIGDTVNTAARLESNAKAEQILISEDVYEKLRDRIEATPVGEIPLKGKSNKIMVYSVDSIESMSNSE